jgi:hypothetical protein
MSRTLSRFLGIAAIFAFACTLHSAKAAENGVQMLPPQDFNGTVCSGTSAGILY